MSSEKTSLFPILLVNFIGTLGYSIILPFLIVLVLDFGGNEVIYGVMGATYAFFQFIGAPILGKWSDRYGRKRILVLSQAGTFLAWALFAIALLLPKDVLFEMKGGFAGAFLLTLPLLLIFVARALDGITGGNVSVANAYLADITTDEDRKKNFGKMAASANLGFIVGPAFAGVLGGTPLEEMLPVLAALSISLIAIFVISTMMVESNPCTISSTLESSKIKKVMGQEHIDCYEMQGKQKTFREILKIKDVQFFIILYFFVFLAFNLFYVSFPVHSIKVLEWDLFELGIFFSYIGGVMVLVQGPILSRLSTRFTERTLIIAGSFMLTLGFLLFTQASLIYLIIAVLLFSGGNGIMWPSFLSLLSKTGNATTQGAIQGYASSAGSLASIFGLIAGGMIYGWMGIMTFILPALVLLVITVLSFKLN